jgi:hypothetical protein
VGGGHLVWKMVRMCDHTIEYKGGVLDRELVTRVTRLGYEIRQTMFKRSAYFKSSFKIVTFLEFLAKSYEKRGGTFQAVRA